MSVQPAINFNGTIPYVLTFTAAPPGCWFSLQPESTFDWRVESIARSEMFTVDGRTPEAESRVFGLGNTPPISASPSGTPPGVTGSPRSSENKSASGTSTETGTGQGSQSTGINTDNNGKDETTQAAGGPAISGTALAGIGVGVAVVVLALGLGGFVWWWKRKGTTQMGRTLGPLSGQTRSDGALETPTYTDSNKYFFPEGHKCHGTLRGLG